MVRVGRCNGFRSKSLRGWKVVCSALSPTHAFSTTRVTSQGENADIVMSELLLPELLSQVFELGLPPYTDFDASTGDHRQRFLSSISFVSVFWKNVAFSSPRLWSLVRVDYDERCPGGFEPEYEGMRSQLERAKNAPLDIILHRQFLAFEDGERLTLWAFWELLKGKHTQWRSL